MVESENEGGEVKTDRRRQNETGTHVGQRAAVVEGFRDFEKILDPKMRLVKFRIARAFEKLQEKNFHGAGREE